MVALLALVWNASASAQRTMPGQMFISGQVSYQFGATPKVGPDAGIGMYLLSSLWDAGVSAVPLRSETADGVAIPSWDIHLYGDWMYRLTGTRTRALNIYGGAGVFAGYEMYDPKRLIPEDVGTGLPEGGIFIYGIQPKLQVELFLTRTFSLVVTGSLPVNFSSELGRFRPRVSGGVRLTL